MTARDLIALAGQHPALLVGLFLLVPAAVLSLGWIHGPGRGGEPPFRHLYGLLVYLACVPGTGAAVLTGYTLFFTHENLLDKDLLVYVVPIVSMGVTLGLIRQRVSFDQVPGFDRILGLMTLLAVTFVVLLAIRKTFVGLFFGGSLAALALIGLLLFGLLKWGAHLLFRRRSAE